MRNANLYYAANHATISQHPDCPSTDKTRMLQPDEYYKSLTNKELCNVRLHCLSKLCYCTCTTLLYGAFPNNQQSFHSRFGRNDVEHPSDNTTQKTVPAFQVLLSDQLRACSTNIEQPAETASTGSFAPAAINNSTINKRCGRSTVRQPSNGNIRLC
jgi:hypothetical protein